METRLKGGCQKPNTSGKPKSGGHVKGVPSGVSINFSSI